MNVPKLPEKPVDRFTIEWWSFDPAGSWNPGIRRHLAIYIAKMTWDEFVADKSLHQYHTYRGGQGASFVGDWMMIGESGDPDAVHPMQFGGRNCGWDWPSKSYGRPGGVDSAKTIWAERYATPQEALEAFKQHAKGWIAQKEAQIAEARAAVERVSRMLT